MLRGRDFDYDDRPNSPLVAILNESAAQAYLGLRDAVGKQFYIFDPGKLIEVIGVVRDVKLNSLRDAAPPMVYLPFFQSEFRGTSAQPASIVMHATVTPPSLFEQAERIIRNYRGSGLTVSRIQTQRMLVEASFSEDQSVYVVSAWFGSFALLLAAVGLYGLTNHEVVSRQRDMAVHLAVGCSAALLTARVIRQSILLVGLSACAGIPVALAATRLVRHMLFNVRPIDPWVIACVLAALLSIGGAASWAAARRIGRVDVMAFLRQE